MLNTMLSQGDGRTKLVLFVPLGFPDWAKSRELIDTLIAAGADGLELGFPFSADFLEGQAISDANAISIRNGYTLDEGFAFLAELRKAYPDFPLAVSSFYDPVARIGPAKFAETFKELDLSLLVCDATPDQVKEWLDISGKLGVGSAFLVTPNTDMDRIVEISKSCSDFMYVAAAKGLCGTTTKENNVQYDFFLEVAKRVDTPIIGGFGINSQERALEVGRCCNGIAVGSAVLERVMNAPSFQEGKEQVFAFVSGLAACLRGD